MRGLLGGAVVVGMLALVSPRAEAFCGAYLGSADAPITNKTSSVVYVREGNRTTITMANDLQGSVSSFAMLIPAPGALTAGDVKVVEPGVVARVDDYAAPRLVEYTCEDLHGAGSLGEQACGCATDALLDYAKSLAMDALPGLLDQLDIGFGSYEVSTLAAESKEELESWASSQGVVVPPGAGDLFEDYIAQGTNFISVKVDLDSVASGGLLLKPIQFSYESDTMSLPIRLGTVNGGAAQDVVIHVITDGGGAVGISNYPEFTVESDCMYEEDTFGSFSTFYDGLYGDGFNGSAGWVQEYVWAPAACDPCTGGGPLSEEALRDVGFQGNINNATITRLHVRYDPDAVDGDLMLYSQNNTAQHQQRYILYKEALEEDFPICEQGWANNPGTCVMDSGGDGNTQLRGGGFLLPAAWLLALGGGLVARRREER
jgi:hypothetical protein